MTLSSEWKTSELRQVAIALCPSAGAKSARQYDSLLTHGAYARSETAERKAKARFEEERAPGENPELLARDIGQRTREKAKVRRMTHVEEGEEVDKVAQVEQEAVRRGRIVSAQEFMSRQGATH